MLVAAAALAALFVHDVPAAEISAKDAAVEKTIRQLEDDWAKALVKRDQTVIDRVVATDWVLCDPTGHMVTKAEADGELISGTVKFDSFEVNDLQVRVYGNTAIVFGLETEKSSYKGADVSGQYRFTDVFVKRGGRWQTVATHVSRVMAE